MNFKNRNNERNFCVLQLSSLFLKKSTHSQNLRTLCCCIAFPSGVPSPLARGRKLIKYTQREHGIAKWVLLCCPIASFSLYSAKVCKLLSNSCTQCICWPYLCAFGFKIHKLSWSRKQESVLPCEIFSSWSCDSWTLLHSGANSIELVERRRLL